MVEPLQDVYQACRDWTIAIFQHVTENDFIIHLLGDSIYTLGGARSTGPSTNGVSPSHDTTTDGGGRRRRTRGLSDSDSPGKPLGSEGEISKLAGETGAVEAGRSGAQLRHGLGDGDVVSSVFPAGGVSAAGVEPIPLPDPPRRRLFSAADYDDTLNPAADVFVLTAGAAAFGSSLPSTVRIVSEGYASVDEDNVELIVASEDLAGLFERNDVGDILRGAVLSPALAVDTYYSAAVSNLSPLFKVPVDAVQRGRDYGLPTYNDARKVSLSPMRWRGGKGWSCRPIA